MPVRVAEYLGQSVKSPGVIVPYREGDPVPPCPFTFQPCIKLSKSRNPTQPVCCIEHQGSLFPVCENRVLPSLKETLSPKHKSQLFYFSTVLFPGSNPAFFRYGLQQTIHIGTLKGKRDQVRLDYVLRTEDPEFAGVRDCVLEVQAGGETSSTNPLTQHVKQWAQSKQPTNLILSREIKEPNPIPNNAWKRTLEQIFRKAPLCRRFGGGFALALGTINFEYFTRYIRPGRGFYPEWEVALVEMGDDWNSQSTEISFHPHRAVFMAYEEFVESVAYYPYREDVPNPFDPKKNGLK